MMASSGNGSTQFQRDLALPPDLALLIKAFITLEGMGCQLDPDFDMAGEATPFLEQVLLAHAAPGALVQRGWRALIVGSAIVMTVGREPGLPSFGLLGFIAAVIGGIWVLFSIWRSGKG